MTWRTPAHLANMFEGFHKFHNEDGEAYGSFEVFWEEGDIGEPGWYWWACQPGCMPEGEPTGPFVTSREAMEDADQYASLGEPA